MSFPWPTGLVEQSLIAFIGLVEEQAKSSTIRRPLDIFRPENKSSTHVPSGAWWDRADEMLSDLAHKSFANVWASAAWDQQTPRPITAALARYEPVLGKISHHYSASPKTWDDVLMRKGKSIQEHFLKLQTDAVERGHFSRIPAPSPPRSDDPEAGLIPLLESMAVYPQSASTWATRENGLMVLDEVLIVGDLGTCPYVSGEGRNWYNPGFGCILVPFVAHDRRLVGYGLVLFDKSLDLERSAFLKGMVNGWRVLFAGTFSPLIANLNSATLSVLDGFFLGRVRELRYLIQPSNDRRGIASSGPSVPRKDLLVLNKVSIYELLQQKLDAEERLWIVFFDLDGFKTINRDLGHQKADEVLFQIADGLVQEVFSPAKDRWLGRFGGDEFIGIVNDGNDTPEDLSAQIGEVIRKVGERYNDSAGRAPRIHLSTSMGWVDSHSIQVSEIRRSELSDERKRILIDMREAERMIEVADTDTQEYVKRLGKNGYLLWKKRSECKCSDAAPLEDIDRLFKHVKKLPHGGKRTVRIEFTYED
jgi:diguanylate cyclase (GGDEF)-like protein